MDIEAYGLLFNLLIIAILTILLVLCYQMKNLKYWENRNIPFIEPNWIFGNIKDLVLLKISWINLSLSFYKEFKSRGFGGIFVFGNPVLVICSRDLVEKILVQDFSYFHDRSNLWDSYQPLSKNLINAQGKKWRVIRHNLGPLFSSGKLKGMFPQISNCSDFILKKIEEKVKIDDAIELEPLVFEFTSETISSCTFGIQLFNSSESIKCWKLVNLLFRTSIFRMMKYMFVTACPRLTELLRIHIYPSEIVEYFVNLTKSTIEYRKQNGIERADCLQQMMTLKDQEDMELGTFTKNEGQSSTEKIKINKSECQSMEKLFTEDFITSQMFGFLFAGTKPSAITVTFALYEVAKNISIQQRLQGEIESVVQKHGGWTYEAFQDMLYLDQVIQETLRLYNFNPMLTRTVTIPYKLPGTNVILEKGTVVLILASAIHMDAQFYPEPECFDPDRFAGNNYKPSATFLAFGHGPRVCIAIKFATLILKVCMARILYQYTVKISSTMQSPLRLNVKEWFPRVVGGVWLTFNERVKSCRGAC